MDILGIKSDTQLLWCFAAGFMAAGVFAFCIGKVRGKLINALVRESADGEKSALSLKQLGCEGAVFRFALRKGTRLADSVIAVNSESGEKLYYLKPDDKEKMLAKYGKSGGGALALALTLLLILIAAFVFAALLPLIKNTFVKLIPKDWK